ncbi:MAG: FtsH protease activity modulator HflK, partial [Chloroflexi bacterium]|nr:FtsH protease activity modulator HflK [Chloroflexota bacterium]
MTTDSTPPPAPDRPPGQARGTLDAIRASLRWLAGEGVSPLADLRVAVGGLFSRRNLGWLFTLAVLAYLLSGVYVVDPGEAAVVRRFGAVVEPRAAPGLHYRLP